MNPSRETINELAELRDAIKRGTRIISLTGLTSITAKSYILSELQRETEKTFVIITATNKDLETWQCDLDFFSSIHPSSFIFHPSFDTDVYSGISPHAETQERRALALWNLAHSQSDFLVISAKSLITKTPSPDEIKKLGANLKLDEDFAPEDLIDRIITCGYVREEPIKSVGEFSVRGGIVDVWSPTMENPVRIEFFGDTVDSIREFDAETQLSINQIKEISIAPMREFAAGAQDFKDWAFFAKETFNDEKFARNLKDRTDFAVEGETFSGWEFLISLTKPRNATVFDFLGDCIFIIDEPPSVEQTLENYYEEIENHYEEITNHGEIGLEPEKLFVSGKDLRDQLNLKQRLELRALGKAAVETDKEFQISDSQILEEKNRLFLFPTAEKSVDFEIHSRSTRKYRGDIKAFANEINQKESHAEAQRAQSENQETQHSALRTQNSKNTQHSKTFVFQTAGLAERFSDILRDYDIILPDNQIKIGDLSAGFEIPSLNLIFHTETDIFGEIIQHEYQKPKSQGQSTKRKTAAFISDFRDLKIGDFVVHVDHGIGRFEGLQTLDSGGISREFMLLVYAENSKLFVPVERLDLVSRYSSGESTQPTLDRLGGLGWQKTKAKAKRAMRDMADELLRLYAERKLVQGFAFSKDAPWQKEFEDAFPYQLTSDQFTSIEDVKNDMETNVPMDRILVGDVGYGKTEVAMRAVFKAVMDGKQVAVLAPTTVLSFQHFETFKQRFAAFPISIEMLSRFRSNKEIKQAIEKAEKGEVDILIGTHRILSNDVKLPKLGLLVVDEEQRFGVAHKEKLKKFKKKVDVLTMSATPIPRTLNMALTGMRDMSVIETPPRDRLAINTQVVQFGESVIKSAIELELSRNGQVFFIHNRVETIDAIAALIKKIVPNARIVVGHGQMSDKELEKVMFDFVDYKFDVLVSTTIIENGIDIPRANTIIINRADTFGLSQLYQLRGRVGRSNRRAYSYLLIPGELQLTPIARRRLSAIREFSDLGAGFRIAALDLELRGAGNILGGQQSGQMDALGFDLYTKMLERTIAELRGETVEDETNVSINMGIDVSIPQEYIGETGQRLRTYKRISSAESEEDLRKIYTEIGDRYGKMPESVENLFEYARLRKLAEAMHIISIDKTADGVAIKLDEKAKVAPENLMEFLGKNEASSFSPNGILRVVINYENLIEAAREVLEEIKN